MKDLQPTQAQLDRSKPLDGIRGTSVLFLMLAHFGVSGIQGAWVGINLFFLFSGFLICLMLLKEFSIEGRVQAIRFYRRRLRRLYPALLLLIFVVATWALLFADTPTRRALKPDLFGTLFYYQNWHLVAQSDQYFGEAAVPSFFRHAWTLAIEEQFYIVVPFFVMAMMRLVRRRSWRVGITVALAVMSAVRTSLVGLDTPQAIAHTYYGTDTRVNALLIGVALAFAVGPDGDGNRPRAIPYRLIVTGAWASAVLVAVCTIWAVPMSPIMFTYGGLFFVTLFVTIGMLAAVDRRESLFKKVFSWQPLVYLGILTYGLYLWHWPIALWLGMYLPDLHPVTHVLVGCTLTIVIASLSFKFLEYPVMFEGARGLVGTVARGRVLIIGSMAVVIAMAIRVGDVPSADQEIASGDVPMLFEDTPPYVPAETETTVMIFGDSIAQSYVDGFPRDVYTDIDLIDRAETGCNVAGLDVENVDGTKVVPTADCVASLRDLPEAIRSEKPDVLLMDIGMHLALNQFLPDGTKVTINDPRLRDHARETLDAAYTAAQEAGVGSVLVATTTCRDADVSNYLGVEPTIAKYLTRETELANRLTDPAPINDFIAEWAAGRDVEILDVHEALGCQQGFRSSVNGVVLMPDRIHFSPRAAAMLWTWVAPQIRQAAQGAQR